MTRRTLITWSIIRDVLNWLFIGQIPGLGQMLDVPLLIMHFRFAGKHAAVSLLELIPGAGLVPIFTIAAFCYPETEAEMHAVCAAAASQPTATPATSDVLYRMVDGQLVPVTISHQIIAATPVIRTEIQVHDTAHDEEQS